MQKKKWINAYCGHTHRNTPNSHNILKQPNKHLQKTIRITLNFTINNVFNNFHWLFCLIKLSAPHQQNTQWFVRLNPTHTHTRNVRQNKKTVDTETKGKKTTETRRENKKKWTNGFTRRREKKTTSTHNKLVREKKTEKTRLRRTEFKYETEKSLSFNRFEVKMCGSILALEAP